MICQKIPLLIFYSTNINLAKTRVKTNILTLILLPSSSSAYRMIHSLFIINNSG